MENRIIATEDTPRLVINDVDIFLFLIEQLKSKNSTVSLSSIVLTGSAQISDGEQ